MAHGSIGGGGGPAFRRSGNDLGEAGDKNAIEKKPESKSELHNQYTKETYTPGTSTKAADYAKVVNPNAVRDVTYTVKGPDGQSQAVTAKEFREGNKVWALQGDNLYDVQKNAQGDRILVPLDKTTKQPTSEAPLSVVSQQTGFHEKPASAEINEKSGRPPEGVSPEKYVGEAPKHSQGEVPKSAESLEQKKSPDDVKPAKTEPAKSELFERANPKDEVKQSEFRRIAPVVAFTAEKETPKVAKFDHISVAPAQQEFQRTRIPESPAQRATGEPLIKADRNTAEYARELINHRASGTLRMPQVENISEEKPPKHTNSASIKLEMIEPKSSADPRVERLQGKAESLSDLFEGLRQIFKPRETIRHADVIEKFSDFKGAKQLRIQDLLPLILIARKLEPKQPVHTDKPRTDVKLQPELQAKVQLMREPQKQKLLEVAQKIKEGIKPEKFEQADKRIAKRVNQLEPKQLDSLIGWAKGLPVNAEWKSRDFQEKLSSLFHTILKVVKPQDASVKTKGEQMISTPEKPKSFDVEKTEKIDKAVTSKTEIVKPEKESGEKTVLVKGETSKGSEPPAGFLDKNDGAIDETGDERTQPMEKSLIGDDTLTSTILSSGKKKIQEFFDELEQTIEQKNPKLSEPDTDDYKITELNAYSRRLELGSLDGERYHVILETKFNGQWRAVIEAKVQDERSDYLIHSWRRQSVNRSMTSLHIIREVIRNNFFEQWAARIQDFLGDN